MLISTFLKGPGSVDELLSLFSSHYYVHIPANYPDACQNQLDDVGLYSRCNEVHSNNTINVHKEV